MIYFASDNKAGKVLAQRLRGCRYKANIPYIIHPVTKDKQFRPKDIADAFSEYYSSLYNLRNYPNTRQPDSKSISQFLAKVSLPQLMSDQLL